MNAHISSTEAQKRLMIPGIACTNVLAKVGRKNARPEVITVRSITDMLVCVECVALVTFMRKIATIDPMNMRVRSQVREWRVRRDEDRSSLGRETTDIGWIIGFGEHLQLPVTSSTPSARGGAEGRGKAEESEVQNLLPNLPPESLTLATMKLSKASLERKAKSLEA